MPFAPTNTKPALIRFLRDGPRTKLELARLLDRSPASIVSIISRLRADGWKIMSELSSEAGNPRYTLVSSPDSLAVGK